MNFEAILTKVINRLSSEVAQPLCQRRDYGGNQLDKTSIKDLKPLPDQTREVKPLPDKPTEAPPLKDQKELKKLENKSSSVTKKRRNQNWQTRSNGTSAKGKKYWEWSEK